jgi:nitrile hydratase subunit alpha
VSAEHQGVAIAARVRRLEQALIDAGLTTDDELDSILEDFLARAKPMNGARLIARAWMDDEFRRRLLRDAGSAVAEMALPSLSALRVIENTTVNHNVVVCTLCSCYPVGLLGPSPSWYKSEPYRARVVREPRAVLAEFGLQLDPEVQIRVWDASAEARYLVLPRRPAGTQALNENELAMLVTRAGMIGTAAV